jgi:hypothetical protein
MISRLDREQGGCFGPVLFVAALLGLAIFVATQFTK